MPFAIDEASRGDPEPGGIAVEFFGHVASEENAGKIRRVPAGLSRFAPGQPVPRRVRGAAPGQPVAWAIKLGVR